MGTGAARQHRRRRNDAIRQPALLGGKPIVGNPERQSRMGRQTPEPFLEISTSPNVIPNVPIPRLVAPSLAGFCTLNSLAMKVPANTPGAIVLADGSSVVHVLVNPKPGEIGTLGSRTLDSFGTFFLDGNVQKSFRHHGAQAVIAPGGCHEHPESSAAQLSEFYRRRNAVRPNRGQGRCNFRRPSSPAKFPGSDPSHVLMDEGRW